MLGLLAEGHNAFLDVGVVHVLNVAKHWNDQTLKPKDERLATIKYIHKM
jgi:hypothetical protein